jgi:hypothetical protein
MTGSIFDNGRRLVLLLENGSVEVWSLDPRGKLARLAVAPLVARQSPGYLTVVAKENLLLLVTRSGELIALDLLTLAPRYRGVVQECCTGPPIVKMRRDTKDGAPESLLLNVVPQVGARLIRIATGEIVGPTFHHEGIRGASFDENGEHLVTYGTDDRAHIWRVDGGTRVGTISHADQLGAPTGQYLPRGGIRGAVFLPGSAEVVLWNYDGTVRVHAVASGKQIGGHMRHLGPVFDVLLLPDNRVLSASNGPVRIWRLPNYALPISSKEGLCTSRWPRLHTVRLARQELGGSAVSVTLYKNGSAELAPALSVDEEDVRLAPILNGRQSEALCGTRK